MDTNKYDVVVHELEEVTGQYIRGDITPVVYDLLKDGDLKELIQHLSGKKKVKNAPKKKSKADVKATDFQSFSALFDSSPLVTGGK